MFGMQTIFGKRQNTKKYAGFWSLQVKSTRLLRFEDMPKHLQFNPYILTGYRPLLSTWGCINSIFYVHNETINILTHGMDSLSLHIFAVAFVE